MSIIRSVSGLRATVGDDLTPELVVKYTASFAKILPAGKIAVGNDGRPSHSWIESVVCGTLAAAGRDVLWLGTVPTPTVELFAEQEDFAGGIAITASHNPKQYNGLKFVNSTGVFLNAEENKALWQVVDSNSYSFSKDNFGTIENETDPFNLHFSRTLKPIEENIPGITDRIREKKFKVVVDAVNASGSFFEPRLLEYFGCKVIKLYCDGSGVFPHIPEPLPVNLTKLAETVRSRHADLGIAVDPDADRLVLIDETGSPIGEERTVCTAIDAVFTLFKNCAFFKKYQPVCAVNYSTTMLADYIVEKHGGKCFRSPVGEINVIGKMKEVGAVIGGEGSGGVIFPEVHYGRDSLVGISLLLAFMTETGKSLGEIAGSYPKYSMLKTKMPFTGSLETYVAELEKQFYGAEIILDDGIKILLKDGWVQLRKSNTEPIIRIIAETNSEKETESLVDTVKKLIDEYER